MRILKGEEDAPPSLPAPRPQREPLAELPAPVVSRESESDEASETAAEAQLGPEGVAQLRTRYEHLTAAISRRISDAQRQDQLKAEAERLNPDRWLTQDDVRRGLEEYESVFESLRGLVGRRRRRRKPRTAGGGADARSAAPSDAGDSEDSQENEDDGEPETGPAAQD